jgi:hypothetical protein
MAFSITKAMMVYGVEQSAKTRKQLYLNLLIQVWLEDTMQVKPQLAKFYKVGYGGQMCTRIPTSMHENVIHVKESANLLRNIGWPISRFYH